MRLLYITNQICGSGGLERVLSIKASYLADKLGYDVHIITLNQGKVPLFYNFSKKIEFHDLTISGTLLSYPSEYRKIMRRSINTILPDIISVCDDGLKGMLLPYILDKKIPKIYERHVSKNIEMKSDSPSLVEQIKSKLTYYLMDKGGKRFDKFVVLTTGNAKEWNFDNVIVISNPLSFYPKETCLSSNKKVLAVGRHAYQKGYDRLLRSWRKLRPDFHDWQLDIFGKIDRNKIYINQAKKMNLAESVQFHEPVKNIEDIYKQASLYVMPSRFEGFGMVLIEAMAYGVPCVSYDCPYGPGDIITDAEDGYLIKNGDEEEFANKMARLMTDSELRERMSMNARKKALKFSVEHIMPQWDNLFKQLVSG